MSRDTNYINKTAAEHDKQRAGLLSQDNIDGFIKMYTKPYDLKNHNDGRYWDDIYKKGKYISPKSPMTKDKIEKIAQQIPYKNISILDIGIGEGFIENKLKERNISYTFSGIDISKESIDKARKRLKGKFQIGNVMEISSYYKEKSFDVIIAIELLEHISVSKIFSLYKQIHSTLKEHGKFILSIPINENLHLMNTNPSAHVRDYRFEIIEAELKLNGFIIEKKYFLFAFNKFYLLKKFFAHVFPNRWKPNSLIIVARKK